MSNPLETEEPAFVKEERDEDDQVTMSSDSNPGVDLEVVTLPPPPTSIRRDGESRNLVPSASGIPGRGPAILVRPNMTAVRSANPNFIRMNMSNHPITVMNKGNQIAFIRGSRQRFAVPVGTPQQAPGGRTCVVMRTLKRTTSTITDVSNKEFNALDRKSSEYDLLKDAYENKLRQGVECAKKYTELKDQCQQLTEENTRLTNDLEEFKSNERNYALQIQSLSNRAQEMEEILDSANMRHEKEFQELNTQLNNAKKLIEKLLHGMNAQFRKGSEAYAKLQISIDDVASIVGEANGNGGEEMELDVRGIEDEDISFEKDEEVEEEGDDLSERGSIVNEETARRISARLSSKPSSAESTNKAKFSHGPGEVTNQCLCGKLFSSKYTLQKHTVRFNDAKKKEFCCRQCPVKFTHGYMLHEHVKLVHPWSKKNFVCRFCGAFLKSRKMLTKHQNTAHGGGPRSYRKRIPANPERKPDEDVTDPNDCINHPD
ncbi:unnamed protein product [Orchesella dallaii]|uniref:C2H2-type domain-containing protein n=1 Tax=Orchesella dallaii TaxID=48710 RepID=A0ABP1Q353_9HEXA